MPGPVERAALSLIVARGSEEGVVGQEVNCKLRLGKKVAEGRALLESLELIFRGPDLRVKIAFREMSSIEAKDGWLRIRYPDGAVVDGFRKVSRATPFGKACVWEAVGR